MKCFVYEVIFIIWFNIIVCLNHSKHTYIDNSSSISLLVLARMSMILKIWTFVSLEEFRFMSQVYIHEKYPCWFRGFYSAQNSSQVLKVFLRYFGLVLKFPTGHLLHHYVHKYLQYSRFQKAESCLII